jgi:hypothetical protein
VVERAQGHARASGDDVRIRVLGRGGGLASVLEIDVPAGWRRLERLKRALFVLRLQVLSSQSQRFQDRLVHWLRVVPFDGASVPDWRERVLGAELGRELGARRKISAAIEA